MNHNVFCQKRCNKGDGLACYAHPHMPLEEHECGKCLIKENKLVNDDFRTAFREEGLRGVLLIMFDLR